MKAKKLTIISILSFILSLFLVTCLLSALFFNLSFTVNSVVIKTGFWFGVKVQWIIIWLSFIYWFIKEQVNTTIWEMIKMACEREEK